MNLIVKMQFGSHVYGTNLPTSDHDYKGIYLPEPRDIILQKVSKNFTQHTKLDGTKKNTAEDVDVEIFSLQEYLKLLMDGQTVAVDMLFTPAYFWQMSEVIESLGHGITCNWTWIDILENKHRFLHKGISSYVGYCRTQAAKYGIKGSRMATLKESLKLFDVLPNEDRLEKHWSILTKFADEHEHAEMVLIEGPNKEMLPHINICDRKMGPAVTVLYAKTQYQRIYDNYGERARMAEKNEGIDFKALMHAARVCGEAEELLLTHNITFPRPEKDLLLKIRKGELPYKQIAEIIETGLIKVEDAKLKSTLPLEPDRKFAEDLVYETYRNIIKNEKS